MSFQLLIPPLFLKIYSILVLKGDLYSIVGHAVLVLETVYNKEQILMILKNEFKRLEELSSKLFNQKKQLEAQKNLRKNHVAELQALIKFNNLKERKIFQKIKLYEKQIPAYVHWIGIYGIKAISAACKIKMIHREPDKNEQLSVIITQTYSNH